MSQRNARVSLKPGKSRAALRITHPNAAGIDIGSASHLVRVAGVARLHRAARQCTPHQERLGAQVRCTGLPMVAAAHDLRVAQRRVSPSRPGVRTALALAPACNAAQQPGPTRTAHAKGAHADERPVGQRHPTHVFSFRGRQITQVSTKAWYSAQMTRA